MSDLRKREEGKLEFSREKKRGRLTGRNEATHGNSRCGDRIEEKKKKRKKKKSKKQKESTDLLATAAVEADSNF